MQKPLPAKGTRDFESLQIYKRNYILDIIKKKHLQIAGVLKLVLD